MEPGLTMGRRNPLRSSDGGSQRGPHGVSDMASTAATYPRAAEVSGFNHARAMFGVVVALIGTAIVLLLYVRGQPQTVEILKAARDLPPGTILQPDDLVAETEPLSDGLSALVVAA